jgi:hypothetical protein
MEWSGAKEICVGGLSKISVIGNVKLTLSSGGLILTPTTAKRLESALSQNRH